MKKLNKINNIEETILILKKRVEFLDAKISKKLSKNLTKKELETIKKDFEEYNELSKKIQILEATQKNMYEDLTMDLNKSK